MALELNDTNFDEITASGISVVDFWAAWCGPCRMIAPIIDDLHKEYEGRVNIGKMDIDNNQEVPLKFSVRSIPTILILKDGEVVDKQVGVTTKAKLAEKIEKYL